MPWENSLIKTVQTQGRVLFYFSSICIIGLATGNKEEKYNSHVGGTLKGNSRINYKCWSDKVTGSPETANGATRKCLT